jgi:two-component system response regulator WspF
MRIAIVNDTQMAVECLRRVICSEPDFELAWIARDGQDAVNQCADDTPDLILMDLIMPVMDGVEATRLIMQQSPCAILLVTSTVTGNAGKVFEAMGAGALDAVNTPVLAGNDAGEGAAALLKKIRIVGKLIKPTDTRERKSTIQSAPKQTTSTKALLAIGASTGGPATLAHVLGDLPADFPGAVVVIQHVDEEFAAGFASWLDDQTPLSVRLATSGERPLPGSVLVAGTKDHLVLDSDGALRYVNEPKSYPYRPSVNVFFESVAANWTGTAVGVLLTGMGSDGASGLLELRNKGCHTIAQDKETCAVYGMPKAAAKLNAATDILPLSKIGPEIVTRFASPMEQKAVKP